MCAQRLLDMHAHSMLILHLVFHLIVCSQNDGVAKPRLKVTLSSISSIQTGFLSGSFPFAEHQVKNRLANVKKRVFAPLTLPLLT
jgi:hypothetical protein